MDEPDRPRSRRLPARLATEAVLGCVTGIMAGFLLVEGVPWSAVAHITGLQALVIWVHCSQPYRSLNPRHWVSEVDGHCVPYGPDAHFLDPRWPPVPRKARVF